VGFFLGAANAEASEDSASNPISKNPRNTMSKQSNQLMGAGSFFKATGLTAARMREAVAAGIIAPARTDSGWRAFTAADVEAARRWKAAGYGRRLPQAR
jgi:hypothetical protein